MPVTLTYPGVYIEEVSSGVHAITGVATSIAAFVGQTPKGPVEDPTNVYSYGDFEATFGGLNVSMMLGFAVRDFFVNGGSEAIIVRLVGGATPTTPTPAPAPPPGPVPAPGPGPGPAPGPIPAPPSTAAAAQITLKGTPGDLLLEAASVGSWGNTLSAVVDYTMLPVTDPSKRKTFNLTIVQNSTAPSASSSSPSASAVIVQEKFLNLSIDPTSPNYIKNVLADQSSLVLVAPSMTDPLPVPSETVKSPSVNDGKGNDGGPLQDIDVTGEGIDNFQQDKRGLYALEKADIFNLLCIPPFEQGTTLSTVVVGDAVSYCEQRRAMMIVDPPHEWGKAQTALTAASDLGQNVGAFSRNAAIFFPRLKQPNPLMNNQMQEFVPCGAVAGVFARTDGQRGVWKAPAGVDATLVGVPQLTVPLHDGENGSLNPLGVNCLRTFPVIGRVVWGARTTMGADIVADDYKYIPVRRLALYIEESLYRGTQWVVFEPNDNPLWAQIRLNVGAFMQTLFRQGAFQGQTPTDAYFVKCDSESTTQNDINLGVVNIIVGFAPLKPAEFVVIQLQQIAGQIQV